MATKRKFSSFLVWTLIAFEAGSLALVVGLLYGFLSRSMTQKFYIQLEAQEAEVNTLLQDRLHQIKAQLRELSLNNTVRVSLMLGVKSQLLEHLQAQYVPVDGVFFYIQEQGRTAFMPELPEYLKAFNRSSGFLPVAGDEAE
jgi:hypothetical protein